MNFGPVMVWLWDRPRNTHGISGMVVGHFRHRTYKGQSAAGAGYLTLMAFDRLAKDDPIRL